MSSRTLSGGALLSAACISNMRSARTLVRHQSAPKRRCLAAACVLRPCACAVCATRLRRRRSQFREQGVRTSGGSARTGHAERQVRLHRRTFDGPSLSQGKLSYGNKGRKATSTTSTLTVHRAVQGCKRCDCRATRRRTRRRGSYVPFSAVQSSCSCSRFAPRCRK